jgi:hypothetical protein
MVLRLTLSRLLDPAEAIVVRVDDNVHSRSWSTCHRGRRSAWFVSW